MLDVLTTSLDIMQVSISRSRLAGEPPDVVIRPRLSDFALLDFHRAEEAIAEGERAAEQALSQISALLALRPLPAAKESGPRPGDHVGRLDDSTWADGPIPPTPARLVP
jgi:predicted acylesterase/phospholipase RssA